jgi:hypothetical protein
MGCLKQPRKVLRKTPIMWWWFKRRSKRGSVGHFPRAKARKRFLMSLRALSIKKKGKSGPSSDEECFHNHKKGQWFRNLEEQKKKKGSETSTSGINLIEINIALSFSDSWVFDAGSMIHTCMSLQRLSFTRGFAKSELDVHVGNEAKVAAIAVSTYHLALPSR